MHTGAPLNRVVAVGWFAVLKANEPVFDVGRALYRMSGVDLTVLEAVDPNTALVLLSEVGPDVGRFPTVKQFTSWLGLCQQHQSSAGKIHRRRVRAGGVQLVA